MKQNITISIDQEVVYKLKGENNYSDVVNEQMKSYYAVRSCENLVTLRQNLTKTKQILKENRKKRREIEAQILKIEKKDKLFKKHLLSRSKMIAEIKKRRSSESENPHKRVQYFITAEEEADSKLNRLKGGGKNK